jgi:hypothetical protein
VPGSQGAAGREEQIVYMQHRVLRKQMGARVMAGSIDRAFSTLSIRLAGSGEGWRLGDTGSVLVLCQVLGIDNDDCFVMSVAVSNDQGGVGIIDTVNKKLQSTVLID